jgi:hypothetical protein
MKYKNIYLDDVRTPTQGEWEIARDYYEFVDLVNKIGLANIDMISLDHDLGDSAMEEYFNNVSPNFTLNYENINEKTGLDCCKFLVNLSIDTNQPLPTIYVHSANPIGSANMMGYINNYLMNCRLPQTCVRVQIPHIVENFPRK